MKLVLVHTMLFVGSTWKNKKGWFLFVVLLGLLMATEIVPTAGCWDPSVIFYPSFGTYPSCMTPQNQ
jgi:hypothetical protein